MLCQTSSTWRKTPLLLYKILTSHLTYIYFSIYYVVFVYKYIIPCWKYTYRVSSCQVDDKNRDSSSMLLSVAFSSFSRVRSEETNCVRGSQPKVLSRVDVASFLYIISISANLWLLYYIDHCNWIWYVSYCWTYLLEVIAVYGTRRDVVAVPVQFSYHILRPSVR